MPEGPFFRIDKFIVPAESRHRFTERLKLTHEALDSAPGCEQNLILEQIEGPGRFNLVTFVRWRDRTCYEAARKAAQKRQNAAGFNPSAFMEDGVVADLGNYADLDRVIAAS